MINLMTARNKLDPETWMTIPEMAQRMGVLPGEAGIVLEHFGLRYVHTSKYTRKISKFPTKKAYDDRYVIEIDGRDSDPTLYRWDFPRIMRLIKALDQLDLPSSPATWTPANRLAYRLAVS